jgi:hypothetical protein
MVSQPQGCISTFTVSTMKNNSSRVSRGQAKRNAKSRKPSLRVIGFDNVPTLSAQALRGLHDYLDLDPDFTEEAAAEINSSTEVHWENYIEV